MPMKLLVIEVLCQEEERLKPGVLQNCLLSGHGIDIEVKYLALAEL